MPDGSVVVPIDILRQADSLIRPGRAPSVDSANLVRQGVELLLRNNLVLSIDSDVSTTTPKLLPGQVDASALLNKGLTLLSNTPFETLDVAIGARTQEIRKAYKKMALKYHPDKNPLTTPLFQVIHAACEKLSDKEQRIKEESKATARARQFGAPQQSTQLPPRPSNPTTYTKRSEGPSTNNAQFPSRYDSKGEQSNESKTSFPSASRAAGGGQQQQFEEMMREQNKKADSDRRAKEFAARHASEAEAARRREVEHAQRVKYQEELKANRDEMLRKAQREYSNYCRHSFDHPSMDELKRNMPSTTSVSGSGSSKDGRVRQQSFESKSSHGYSAIDSHGSVKGSASAHQNMKVDEPVYQNKPPSDIKIPRRPSFVNQPQLQPQSQPQPQPVPSVPHRPTLPIKVPVPFGLKCSSIGTTMVELEWQTSLNHPQTLSVELSWKNRAIGLRVWESANKLITSGRCRKKNLTAGAVYEFRIRAVEEILGGMLGNRSEWAESILVTLLQPMNVSQEKQPEKNNPANSSTTDTAKPVAQTNNRPPVPMPSFHFQRFPTQYETAPPTTSTPAAAEATILKTNARPQKTTSDKGTRGSPNSNNINSEVDEEKEAKLGRKISSDHQKEAHEVLQPKEDNNKSNMKKTQSSLYMDKSLSVSARHAWGIWGQQQQHQQGEDGKSETVDTSAAGPVKMEGNAAGSPKNPSTMKSPFKRSKSVVKDIEDNDDGNHEVEEEEEEDFEDSDSNSIDAESVDDDDADDENEEVSSSVSSKCVDNHNKEVEEEEEEVAEEECNSGDDSNSIQNDGSVASSLSSNTRHRKVKIRRGVTYKATTQQPAQSKEPSVPLVNACNAEVKVTEKAVDKEEASSKAEHERNDDYSDVFDLDDEGISDEEVELWFQLKAPPAKNTDGTIRNDIEYRHPVRAEPFSKSKVVGYLVTGVAVVATADCGDWLKVKIHTPCSEGNPQPVVVDSSGCQLWGWCLRRFKNHEFLSSTNGIIIEDMNEAMKYRSHYSLEHINKKKDELNKKEAKAKQLAESVPHGKENKITMPTKAKEVDYSSPLQRSSDASIAPSSSSSSSSSPLSPNSNAQFSPPPPLARCNSIRLPPIDSPTKPLEPLNVLSNDNKIKVNSKNLNSSVSKKSAKVDLKSGLDVRSESKQKDIILEVEVWSELKDESNHIYYYNAVTKQSKWEPPEWIQEWDPSTGSNYYLHYSDETGHKFSPKSLHSTWTKPEKFAKLKKYT